MGDYLERITEKGRSVEALIQKIILFLNTNEKKILIAEAGDDKFLYSIFLKRLDLHKEVVIYLANGRGNVINAISGLQKIGKREQIFGIVDRDYFFDSDSFILGGHCYVLPCFSIENLFLRKDVLDNIAYSFFALEEGGDDRKRWSQIIDKFIESLSKTFVIQWAIAYWCVNNKKSCFLGNFSVLSVTTFRDDGSIEEKNDALDEFKRVTKPDIAHYTETAQVQCENIIRQQPPDRSVRGHYFWTLFCYVLNQFRDNIDREAKEKSLNRQRTRAELTERHILESATNLIDAPIEIQEFFRQSFSSARHL